jgi:26S proteasome regulatory subunit N4
MLAQNQNYPRRQSPFYQPQNLTISSRWPVSSESIAIATAASAFPSPPQTHYVTTNEVYNLGSSDQYEPYNSSPSLMQEHSNNSWLSNGQLTPTSTTRAHHHRESSLSSLGSAGPASPYTANTSNPQVAGDIYHEFHDYQHSSSKPLTPAHTPSQEQFLTPHYTNYYPTSSNLAYTMSSSDGLPKQMGNADLVPVPEYNSNSARRSVASVASRGSPATPPLYEVEERQKNGKDSNVDFWPNEYLQLYDNSAYRIMPKLDRTMTDVYNDELYNPSFQITSAPSASTQILSSLPLSPNDVFTQRLQAANNQHLSASNTQVPLTIPSRERSPFRQGSPLAPTGNNFGSQQSPSMRFGTATHMREQQKAENDARALQQQLDRTSPEQPTPKTISPKEVDLVYHENEEDTNMPLFPPQQQQRQSPTVYRQQPAIARESSELDDTASNQSYASMATSRRQSSSAYSTSSQVTQQQGNFNFAPPAIPGNVIPRIPQQYPFVPQSRRQQSNMSNVSEEFPATLQSMESSNSEYAPETDDNKKPASTSADTGTYTCTYHACTLRFETPAKLQRHKREGHRNSAALMASGDENGGMTSAALRNTQNGPHKCERINPSTGKPCNTIFSRPYDLTRHEDTIHNARKQKVRCHLCTEEKTFSRNDALTRHFRVCHPEHIELAKSRRRGGRD